MDTGDEASLTPALNTNESAEPAANVPSHRKAAASRAKSARHITTPRNRLAPSRSDTGALLAPDSNAALKAAAYSLGDQPRLIASSIDSHHQLSTSGSSTTWTSAAVVPTVEVVAGFLVDDSLVVVIVAVVVDDATVLADVSTTSACSGSVLHAVTTTRTASR